MRLWWPLLIVIFGVSILLGHRRRQRRVPAVSTTDFDVVGVFGGSQQRVRTEAFAGGSATAVFSGVEVDVREANVAEPSAVVTAVALFGGVELVVPEKWTVENDALPVSVAIGDERPGPAVDVAPGSDPDLVVTGFVTFGGIPITD